MSDCITQDDVSVNKRSDMNQYPAMVYGWALMRLITYIAALCLDYPEKKILTSK